ncbi:MAG: hypothetical protein GF341_11630 [candidate division Zixibacteria bacterium]|nr:hypothetical protein [candidate division Zixibacteria bacterium]
MFPDKHVRAIRRLRRRNAKRRQRRLQTIQSEVESRAQSRWGIRSSSYPSRLIDAAAREDGARRPTRQELQVAEQFHHATRELGLA